MTQNAALLLCAAGLVLALAMVLVDRLNFPQEAFKAKTVDPDDPHVARDRTGAHVSDLTQDEA